jgi:hypothetical protein
VGNTQIVYELTPQTSAMAGVVGCEIRLYGIDGELITSPRFIMVVDDRVVDYGEAIDSESESTTIENIIASEEQRIENETARQEAEQDRVDAEEERKEKDIERGEILENLSNNKLDKIDMTEKIVVYIVTEKGEQSYLEAASTYETASVYNANTIMMRNSKGRCEIADPESDYQIANKKYVDNSIDEALSRFVDVSKDWLTITFKVGGIECKAESGMTWAEWCETEDSYYADGLKFDCEGSIVSAEGLEVRDADGNFVLPTDVIIPNYEYLWE